MHVGMRLDTFANARCTVVGCFEKLGGEGALTKIRPTTRRAADRWHEQQPQTQRV